MHSYLDRKKPCVGLASLYMMSKRLSSMLLSFVFLYRKQRDQRDLFLNVKFCLSLFLLCGKLSSLLISNYSIFFKRVDS